jgi:hypothetical protein
MLLLVAGLLTERTDGLIRLVWRFSPCEVVKEKLADDSDFAFRLPLVRLPYHSPANYMPRCVARLKFRYALVHRFGLCMSGFSTRSVNLPHVEFVLTST